jgi:N-acyl homoserine lactone hydrolase
MMWDLGMPDNLAVTHARLTYGPLFLSMSRTLKSQLAELNLDPADIRVIAISHGDVDHIGNADLFSHSTFVVDARERVSMFSAEYRRTVIRYWGTGPGGATQPRYFRKDEDRRDSAK